MNSTRRPTLRFALAVLSLAALATACGPSSSSPESSAVPTTAPVSTTATTAGTSDLADCPFSGTLEVSQSTGLSNAVASAVHPERDGCIDTIPVDFATLPPSWTVAYASGPITDATGQPVTVPGPTMLVVTFLDTTLADGKTPLTVAADSLDHVNEITVVSAPNDSLQVVISLDERAEYTTSVSRVPPNFTLAIG